MRNLKHRLHGTKPNQSTTPELFLLSSTCSQSQTPAGMPVIGPSAPRFSVHPSASKYRQPTMTKGLTGNRNTKSLEPVQNRVRFEVEDDEESDSQHEIGREEGTQGKISKPPGEPGRPRSGGYKLEAVLGWNEAIFEAVRVSLDLEETERYLPWCIYRIMSTPSQRKS